MPGISVFIYYVLIEGSIIEATRRKRDAPKTIIERSFIEQKFQV